MRQLDSRAITKSEFIERLKSPALLAALKPAQPTVTLPFKMIAGVPCIEATVGQGKTIQMMIDTGAARVMMHAGTAAKHGFPIVRADQAQVTMVGIVGNEQGRLGIAAPLQLGSWEMVGYPCFIRTQENRILGAQLPENILGFDLPSHSCSYLTLDYRKRLVTFGFSGLFTPQADKKSSYAPFVIIGDVPFIIAESKGQRWKSLVDTGSFNGIEIDETVARKLAVQDKGKPVVGLYLAAVGGTVSSAAAKLRTVTLPNIDLLGGNYAKPEIDISPGIPRVGSFFLKDYCVTFDFRRKRICLQW